MPNPWTLVLKLGEGDPMRRVGGLPLALRLCLDAQRAGAHAVLVDGASAALEAALNDPRVKLERVAGVPTGDVCVELPAHLVVHRQVFSIFQPQDRTANERLGLDSIPMHGNVPYWFSPVEVIDAASAHRAESALFRSLRKREDGWTSRWLNRYISLAVSRHLAKTDLSPNRLSIAILAIGLLGAYLAARGSYGSMLLGAFLFQLQSVLDGCDGELSRVTYRGSYLGEWLDTIGDDITNYAFFAGASIGLYRNTGSPIYALAGAVMLVSGIVTSAIEYRYLLSIHSGDLLKYPLSQATTNQSGRFGAIAPLFKRDTFVFLTLVAAAANVLGLALVAFSVAAVGILLSVLATERRLSRERKGALPQ